METYTSRKDWKASVLFLFYCLLILACSKPETEKAPIDFELSQLSSEIKLLLTKEISDITYPEELKQFYKSHSYNSIWHPLRNDSLKKLALIELLFSAEFDGLNPTFYHANSIKQSLHKLSNDFDSLYKQLAHIEILISDGLIALQHDKVFGRINPLQLFGSNYMLPIDTPNNFDIYAPLDYKYFKKTIESPSNENHIEYQKLKLALLRELENNEEDIQNIEVQALNTIKLRLNEPFDHISELTAILINKGYLDVKDSALSSSETYNRKLFNAVKNLQEDYGLHPDGVLGLNTILALNFSKQEKIAQIQANMERCRWFKLQSIKTPFVYVNLPEYKLYLHYLDSIRSQKICIGKKKPKNYNEKLSKFLETKKWYHKPVNFETPQIHSKIRYMVVNPKWGVPKSIVMREMWHLMKKDSCYLSDHHYEVYQNNKLIDGDTINWDLYKADKQPFHIKQKAGEFNALGRIKFIFPNPFSIYLHDTPQKSKFENAQRSVSHGCVRVEKPIEIGEFLIRQNKKISRDDFRMMMGQKPLDQELEKQWETDTLLYDQIEDSTKIIFLDDPICIFFDYRTISFSEDDKIQYFFDIYGQDKLIIDELCRKQSRNTLVE